MKPSFSILLLSLVSLFISAVANATEIVGMERAQVITQFGEPQSVLKSSRREILNYSEGELILEDGKVASFDGTFSLGQSTSQAPEEKSAAVVKEEAVAPISQAPDMSRRSVEPFWWSHTLVEAQSRSKQKEGRKILAFFTGPDWCGPCQELEAEVLNTDEFKRLGRKQFIPLKIALYMNSPQSPQAKAEYYKLSKEYGVEGVPNFVILNTDGTVFAKPDLYKRRKGVTNRLEQTMAAILEAEEGSAGSHLYLKIGVGVVTGGAVFIFLRK
jgi:thioredoxin-related protein